MLSLLKMSWAGQYADVAPLVVWLGLGIVFFMHGYQKLGMGVDGVAGFLGSLGFPLAGVFAVILIAVEVIGGLALILGVATRLSAALAGIVAIVAFFTVHVSKGFFVSGGGYELILVLFVMAVSLLILITGAGKYSVDAKVGL